MPLSGGVRRVRRSANGSAAMRSRRDSSRATSADWLNPRSHSRVRWSGTGDQQRLVRPSPTKRRHVARHRLRDRDLAAVFQADRQAARQFAIGDCGAGPRDPRRLREAGGANARRPVASSGMPQIAHPPSPRNSTCFQQSGQKLCTSAMIMPQPAQRGGSAKSSTPSAPLRMASASIVLLVAHAPPAHKRRDGRRPVRSRSRWRCAAGARRAWAAISSFTSARSPIASNGSA